MAFWGRKAGVPLAVSSANGATVHGMTGLEQHEWRASTWQAQSGQAQPAATPAPAAVPLPFDDDFVLTPEMAEPVAVMAETPPAPEPVAPPPPAIEIEAPQPEPVERTDETGRSQFFAGRGVKMKAEVSGCDIFRVEGEFEGVVTARRMSIAASGIFKGTGHVEEADIEGLAEGTLTVAGVLAVRATGRVTGTVSYGQIEIERGGHLKGDIAPKQAGPAAKPGVAAAAAPEPPRISVAQPPAIDPATPVKKPLLAPLAFSARRPPN